jgi:hypothetical protein
MKIHKMIRLGVLSLAVGSAFAPSARADWLRNLCHKDGCADKQKIVIPSREIEVVTERPSVSVRELGPRTRTVRTVDSSLPMVGTLYVPMTFPMVGTATRGEVGTTTREVEETRLVSNPFAAAHRAELALFQGELAKGELQRTIEYQNRILQRILSTTPGTTGTPSVIEEKVDKLAAQVEQLNKRLTDVERLLIYHDNLLQHKPNPAAPTPKMEVPLPK